MAATPPHVLAEEEEEEAEPKEEEEGNQCAVAAADDLCLTATHRSVSIFPTGNIPTHSNTLLSTPEKSLCHEPASSDFNLICHKGH